MPLRLAFLAAALPAVVGFQLATRLAPVTAVRAPTPAMLDVPTVLLAKSEADVLLMDSLSYVFPLGTAAGLAVRRSTCLWLPETPSYSLLHCACGSLS